MRITDSSDFPTPLNTTYRSLRHLPRAPTRKGLDHTTIVVLVVAASVGSLLVIILCWRIFSRLSSRSRSAPLPPRQPLVHHREHQLAAFSEYKNVPDIPIHCGSNVSLVPHTDEFPADIPNPASLSTHEMDGGINDNPLSSDGTPLSPPTPSFFTPHLPPSASSTSLLSSNDHSQSSLSSRATSPNPSSRRPNANREPRPYSVVSDGTSHTGMTARSRSSARCAPHAPHSNVQIVLPAPLAPDLYSRCASEDLRRQRSVVGDNTYRDSWRDSMADKWISVGQHAMPASKSIQRRSRHDSMEVPKRLMRRMYAAALIASILNLVFIGDPSLRSLPQRRSSSNPPSPSRLRQSSGPSPNDLPSDSRPPLPHIPSEFETPPKRGGRMPSVPTSMERH
jgi:hypothetical protein